MTTLFTKKPLCAACGEGRLTSSSRVKPVVINKVTLDLNFKFKVCDKCGAELTDNQDSLDNQKMVQDARRKLLLEESPDFRVIRPWKVLKVQIKDIIYGLLHFPDFDRTITYTDVRQFKVLGIAWEIDYLMISRLTTTGHETVLYEKPGEHARTQVQYLRTLRKVTREYHERMAKERTKGKGTQA